MLIFFFTLVPVQDMAVHSSSEELKVDVKVNTAPPEDLAKILAGIRQDYEAIIEKNSKSLEAWFQQQVNRARQQSPLWSIAYILEKSFLVRVLTCL